MATPVDDIYTAASGQAVVFGKFASTLDLNFTDGVAEDKDLASDFPGYVGLDTDDALPNGMTLLPLSKILRYDGTPGASNKSINIEANPAMPEFTLVNANAASVPACVGIVFPVGAVDTPFLSTDTGAGIQILRRWGDGSIAHARACGLMPTNQLIRISDQKASGNLMTEADVILANPFAEVILDIGSVYLQDLIASGSAGLADNFTLYTQTETMVECHYRSIIGTSRVEVEFHVRVYASGDVWVGLMLEDPYMIRGVANDTAGTIVNGTITIGTTTVRNLSNWPVYRSSMNWVETWITATQYSYDVSHNVNQVIDSKRIPAMGMSPSISSSRLDGLYQNYQWQNRGDWSGDMGGTGFQPQIGHLPQWDCDWIISGGDYRAYRSVLANSLAHGGFPTIWRANDHEIMSPADNPDGSWRALDDSGGSGSFFNKSSNEFRWERAHAGVPGYLAYLLTGDAVHRDLMLGCLMSWYQAENRSAGRGVNRLITGSGGQQRTIAWWCRSAVQAIGIVPDNYSKRGDLQTWLTNHLNDWRSRSVDSAAIDSELGVPFVCGTGDESSGQALIRAWQCSWWPASVGLGSELDPLDGVDLARWLELRDWMYQFPVGIHGRSPGGYCFTYAGVNNIRPFDGTISNTSRRSATQCRFTWDEIYQTFPNNPCTNVLQGPDTWIANPATASQNWWGNQLPALQLARSHGAPGAEAAFQNLSGADNYNDYANSFQTTPSAFGFTPWPVIGLQTKTVNIDVAATIIPGADYDLVRDEWTPSYDGNGNILPGSIEQIPLSVPGAMRWGKVLGTSMRPIVTQMEQHFGRPYGQLDRGLGNIAWVLNAYTGGALAVPEGKFYSVAGGGHNDSSLNALIHLNLEKLGSADSWGIDAMPEDPNNWSQDYRDNPNSIGFTLYRPSTDVPWPRDNTPGGFPTSMHCYMGCFYIPNRRWVCRQRNSYWAYDLNTNQWVRRVWVQDSTQESGYVWGMMHYNEPTDQIYGYNPRRTNDYYNFIVANPDTGNMARTSSTGVQSHQGWSTCEMFGEDKFFFVGQNGDNSGIERMYAVNKSDLSRAKQVDIGSAQGAVTYNYLNEQSAIAYIPQWRQFLRRLQRPTSNRWRLLHYDNETQQIADTFMQGNIPPFVNYPSNKMFYYPPHKCIYYISTTSPDADAVYVMRTG